MVWVYFNAETQRRRVLDRINMINRIEKGGGMKKFLMLLVASYIPGMLLLFGEWPKALGFAAVSILFLPYFAAWAVIGALYDVVGWYVTGEWRLLLFVVSYILYIVVGLVFLMMDERRARWTAFAFYIVMLLLSMYGFAWFCNSYD